MSKKPVPKKAKRPRRSCYAIHPGFAMEESVLANLKRKTGRSAEEWKKLLEKAGPRNPSGWSAWLKEAHGLGTNTARFVAERAAGLERKYDPEKYVEEMFEAKRRALRPLYEEILRFSIQLGHDVTATPCKTIIPLRRRFVFAQVKPVSNSKIELGFALGETKLCGNLVSTGGLAKGDRITHKIALTSVSEFGAEAKKWLKRAYEKCPRVEA